MAVHAYTSSLDLIGSSPKKGHAAHGLVLIRPDSVPFSAVGNLSQKLTVPQSFLLEVIGLADRTAIRRKHEGYLKPDEADRLFRVARIFEEAVRIFGTEAKAAKWLTTVSPFTYDAAPVELLDSDAGAQAVSEELVRIDFGDFA